MAFTTVAGTGSSPDSFFGTQGIDTISLNTLANGAWLGARQADDVITIAAPASRYTLNAGAGNDTITYQAASTISNSRVFGDAGQDTINIAAVSNSTISGGQGLDLINAAGLVSSALINGNQGEDQININAGATNSSIFGGIDNDAITITTQLVNSVVQSNEGADTITIAAGTTLQGSTVNGNQGNDLIVVNAIAAFTTSTLFGGDGNDTIDATNSNVGVLMQGDGGNDQLTGGLSNDSFNANSGTDAITNFGTGGGDQVTVSSGATANATIVAANTLTPASSNTGILNASTVAGIQLATNAVVSFAALGGTNGVGLNAASQAVNGLQLLGSTNADSITGGSGSDTITGGAGADQINPGSGSNVVNSGSGLDTVTIDGALARNANTVNLGLDGAANLTTVVVTSGTARATTIQSVAGVDDQRATAAGSNVGVIMTGTAAGIAVNFIGGDGDDSLSGNSDTDTLSGGAGNDTINGGAGADRLTGGGGGSPDQFNYSQGALTFAQEVANTGAVAAPGVIDVLTDFTSTLRTVNFTVAGAGQTIASVANANVDYAAALAQANAAFTADAVVGGQAYFVAAYGAGGAWTSVLFIDSDAAAGGTADGAIQIREVGNYGSEADALAGITVADIV